jgi:dTDP-4-dehydrorhamnose 3,5-epimerase
VIFEPTPIFGAFVLRPEPQADERGFFARLWCRDEFARHGIAVGIAQASVSFTSRAGTLRGMHFSWAPATEGKLVRCSRGRVFDAIVDLRPESQSFLTHYERELDAPSYTALYVPPGVAHGFQTLAEDCEVVYMMTDVYRPELAAGVRYDDPIFGLRWPLPVTVIADRDRGFPDFDPAAHRRLPQAAWTRGGA